MKKTNFLLVVITTLTCGLACGLIAAQEPNSSSSDKPESSGLDKPESSGLDKPESSGLDNSIYTRCGLGAIFFPNDNTGSMITNITWDLGTTALSSEASNTCTRDKGEARVVAALQFIHNSYAVIEFEIANGNGKYLNTLLTLLEVSDDEASQFKLELRSGFTNIVSNIEYSDQTTLEQTKALFNLAQAIKSDIS